MRADQRFLHQRDELLHHRQMRIIAPPVSHMAWLSAALMLPGNRGFLGIE
jgi:hypothetical protein